jgi:hypothetical protein
LLCSSMMLFTGPKVTNVRQRWGILRAGYRFGSFQFIMNMPFCRWSPYKHLVFRHNTSVMEQVTY